MWKNRIAPCERNKKRKKTPQNARYGRGDIRKYKNSKKKKRFCFIILGLFSVSKNTHTDRLPGPNSGTYHLRFLFVFLKMHFLPPQISSDLTSKSSWPGRRARARRPYQYEGFDDRKVIAKWCTAMGVKNVRKFFKCKHRDSTNAENTKNALAVGVKFYTNQQETIFSNFGSKKVSIFGQKKYQWDPNLQTFAELHIASLAAGGFSFWGTQTQKSDF